MILTDALPKPQPQKRFFIYDNLKFLLILFVVAGHFSDELTVNLYGEFMGDPTLPISDFFNKVYIFLYAFHMPLFLFISGLFHQTSDRLDTAAAGRYLILGLLLKMLLFVSKAVFQTDFDLDKQVYFSLVGSDGAYWYLIALAAFILICHALRSIKPAYVMGFSLLLACCVGYDNSIGDDYTLARIINFFPFFYAGVLCSPEKVCAFFKKPIFKILGAALIGLWGYLSFARLETVYPLRMLFTGRNSFFHVSEATDMDIEFWHRLLTTAISALLCAAFLAIGVNRKIPFVTKAGSRTLQIYFWHRTVIYFLMYIEFPQQLAHYFPNNYKAYYLLTALAVTLILSLKPFGVPLNAVIKAIPKKSKEKNND